jgi:transposase
LKVKFQKEEVMTKAILSNGEGNTNGRELHMAMELSNSKWKLGFGDGGVRVREKNVPARDLDALQEAISRAKKKFKLAEDARVLSCYEAGRDGFWLHRYLESVGIENLVVDSSSIEVSRRKRKKKTDRLDVKKLLRMLIRHHGGEKDVWSIVRVPSVRDEDERRLHRERGRLKQESTAHINRIRSLLVTHGIQLCNLRNLLERLEEIRLWDGSPLPGELRRELEREWGRLEQVWEQLSEVEGEQKRRVKEKATPKTEQVEQLMWLRSINVVTAWPLVMEFFGWREFANGRQVGSLSGLTGTPFGSGDDDREQGISKAGNRRIRTLMIELAWRWLYFQPNSKLTLWYNQRFAHGSKRMRKVGIVALARRLLVDLWRYLESGVVPEGAELKPRLVF